MSNSTLSTISSSAAACLTREVILDPSGRQFPSFSLTGLLGSVFEPIQGCKVCVLIDFDHPAKWIKDFAFVDKSEFPVQNKAYDEFFLPMEQGAAGDELGLASVSQISPQQKVALFAYKCTNGSNLDLDDEVWNTEGTQLSFERDIYPNYDIVLCISTFSATAPLTEKCKIHGFRGATMHGLNDIILHSGLAVNYDDVSSDAEKVRFAMTKADAIEIDFGLEDGRVLTAWLGLDQQEAQKSHGLCKGRETPDIANLPAGEVYFVPTDAHGQFPMKYEDGTLGVLDVENRSIIRSSLIEGNQSTIDEHNQRLADDPMTGTIGELGFGTQVLPVSGQDIQDEKVLGTCHLATGRDDHLGGDIIPSMFKKHENSTHDDILFAPHKTPNFDIKEVRMKRGGQEEVIIEHFRPSEFILEALGVK